MRYGIDVINFGAYGEPSLLQEVAATAEAAGWEGVFLWDHLAAAWGGEGPGTADPWILLAAVACVTDRMRIGTNVTPLPRHRPHVLATQVATIDRLSAGRVVLGVGLGGVIEECERFGEPTEAAVRAEMVDEALEVLAGLWSGDRVEHRGRHYTVAGVRNSLTPIQRPRPTVWVGGWSPPALRRAARWDGWTAGITVDEHGRLTVSPDMITTPVRALRASRTDGEPFEVVVSGYTEPSTAGADLVAGYERAGATWWLESLNGFRGTPEQMLARVTAGPPSR